MSIESPSDAGPPADRREFFRRGLARLFEPLADYIEERVDFTGMRLHLRPPGALPEAQFVATCQRSGNCVSVCPADAIHPLKSLSSVIADTPTIDPDVQACVACETVACTQVCPSGALQKLTDPRQIRMGLARVNHKTCVRSRGESCTLCVEKCPTGPEAIGIGEDGRVEVFESGCTGCGVCQMVCPTSPKAIVVGLI